jgi:hypothetical protein
MNMKYALLVTLIGTSVTITAHQATQTGDNEQQLKNWFISYATPCIAGGIVGSISGRISAYAINKTLSKLLVMPMLFSLHTEYRTIPRMGGLTGLFSLSAIVGALIAEEKLRTKCLDSLNQSFDDHGIKHGNLTNDSAWIMSWLSFLRSIA